jgi:hypothetical protein
LFNGADLAPLATLAPTDYAAGATAISMDAATAYLATSYGYLKVRVSDQSVLERVALPFAPTRLTVLPNRATLIAVGGGRIMAIDLR